MKLPYFFLLLPTFLQADDFTPENTQKPGEEPPTPLEAAAAFTAPEGFKVTLFAGEPDIRQPIALATDPKGRLWAAESYSYHQWDKRGKDRVLIFEDKDEDGTHDSRKVFWTGGKHLSGMTVGWGGVWVCDSPNLLFIPDKNRDDVPDGPPEIVLDGFTLNGKHNFVNGLTWGIDGWLYGRHGITAPSKVGAPGTPDTERVDVDCSIWRYHPVTKKFEVVCRGTTNPWGMDWNDVGEMFMTGNVNGHLWHAIPGAYYPRMQNHGEGFGTHIYGRIQMAADHLHHAGSTDDWTKTRDGVGVHGKLGGGHSHCGGMIYLGGRWPKEYNNTIFMANTHGRKINRDSLERSGSGYVGTHHPDFLSTTNQWFKGVSLLYGPDGNVYLSDWCDLGECHDHDGVHRTSGRIYKISYEGNVASFLKHESIDLHSVKESEFPDYLLSRNEWVARTSRQVLQERFAAGEIENPIEIRNTLQEWAISPTTTQNRIRAILTLQTLGIAERQLFPALLRDENEYIRARVIQLLCDHENPNDFIHQDFRRLAKSDPSPLVRLHLASILQRIPDEKRWPIAEALASHKDDAADQNIPYMIWYGIKDIVPDDPERALELAASTRFGNLTEWTIRRLVDSGETELSFAAVEAQRDKTKFGRMLSGIFQALKGRPDLKPPANWPAIRDRALTIGDFNFWNTAIRIESHFDNENALAIAEKTLADPESDRGNHNVAIEVLARAADPKHLPLLITFLDAPKSRQVAIRALSRFEDPIASAALITRFPKFEGPARSDAIVALTSNKSHARALIAALGEGSIPKSTVTAFHARRIQSLKDGKLLKEFSDAWGTIKTTKKEQAAQIKHWENQLRPDVIAKADLKNGQVQFETLCAACHTLHEKGGNIGLDLTGANRGNLYYLLENIIAPNASLAADYRMTLITLKDKTVLTGNIASQNEYTVTLRTLTGDITTNRKDIATLETSETSVMPEGLLNTLTPEATRDLIAYLQK